jgi:tetratricopeptide (TPR) repeat protein
LNIAVNHPAQPRDPYAKAEAAAKKAVALDESLSEAHSSLGRLMADKWDWQHADAEFRRAIELNPNSGKARLQYAVTCLSINDKLDEAIEHAKQAQSLDLIAPEVYGHFAMLLHCKRRYDEAINVARQALEMNPKAMGAQNMLGRSYTQKGMMAEALAAFEKAESFGRRSHWAASLVSLHARLGRRARAEELVEQWKARPIDEFGHSESMAMAYAGLGNIDEAFRWLQAAYEQRWSRLPWIKIAPEYDSLRSDPRFEALIKKMGL